MHLVVIIIIIVMLVVILVIKMTKMPSKSDLSSSTKLPQALLAKAKMLADIGFPAAKDQSNNCLPIF